MSKVFEPKKLSPTESDLESPSMIELSMKHKMCAHAINKELEGTADKNNAGENLLEKTYENSNGPFLFGKDGTPRAKF